MKTTLPSEFHPEQRSAESHLPRYQIYRQARAGNFMLEFKSDSAFEAVEYFALISPAYEGGAIRLWDEREQRTGAEVEWKMSKTELGVSVLHRTHVFHDPILASIACQTRLHENIREEARQGVRMSA